MNGSSLVIFNNIVEIVLEELQLSVEDKLKNNIKCKQ